MLERGVVAEVDGERLLVADRLRHLLRLDRPRRRGSTRARGGGARPRCRARRRASSSGRAASSPDGARRRARRAGARSPARRPRGARHRSGWRNVELGTRLDDEQAVGLGEVAGQLRQQLGGRDADRRGEAGLVAHPRADRDRAISGPVPCRRRGAGDVEERLVERDRLDERRERAQDRHDLAARVAVERRSAARGTRRRGTRAAPAPSASRSSTPKRARLVARGRDDTARAEAADDHRPARRARDRRAARPTRRTRRGRRAGSTARRTRRATSPVDAALRTALAHARSRSSRRSDPLTS